MSPLFELGGVVVTAGVIAALKRNGQKLGGFLFRHGCGDWGEVPRKIARENQKGLKRSERIMSSFHLDDGQVVWVVTGADRSLTAVLLPWESVLTTPLAKGGERGVKRSTKAGFALSPVESPLLTLPNGREHGRTECRLRRRGLRAAQLVSFRAGQFHPELLVIVLGTHRHDVKNQ